MTRREWLLVLCAYEGAPSGLDPVRLQKSMFLFARSDMIPAQEQYSFKPYDYGPMSSMIYRDLDELVSEGLLARHSVAGKQWSRYAVTERGRTEAEERLHALRLDHERAAARRLHEIKQHVSSVSFNELLDGVYREHPDMAVNSVFRRPT
ncbi:MAG: hypothetical protein QOJ35_3436 [Solirubrobacteraceae bacterium]|nr:hypothetical protein [Solirubrobacteraceae bacterium]